ncbi:alpha/beta hydrolase [Lysinibacillus piscis]|uniref:Alpha/beta hydrolase n=1 Tax=Lysinibacillus piscis TaxID=2518931 RepID=A0ABQ5NGQ2_9BACI|nr:alpha/beta hydrolase [Lysinibacillus sp. KH24]GLC87229.1 alpha/beta hydrolase [Lysinibacillus sp. KH24]
MKKKTLLFSGITTTLAAAAAGLFGFALSNRIMYIPKKDPEFVRERETSAQRFDEAWYNKNLKYELNIDSPNGYTIRGAMLQPLQTTNTIIICHGVTENKINSVKYARLFERLGFNSVIFDHRRHGDSGGKTTSYGHYEKNDLDAVVKTVKAMIGEDAILGIHGESMGAATMLLYAGTIEDGADFYIADCAFSDFSLLLQHIAKSEFKYGSIIPIRFVDFFVRLRDGYSFKSVTPAEAVTHIDKPVLFIHSIPDTFIPASMSLALYDKKAGTKKLKLFDKGAHAQSFNENMVEYEQLIQDFLQDIH